MKIKILILLTLISMSCFSQSIGEVKLWPNPISKPFTIQFKVNYADTISLNIIDMIGKSRIKIFKNEFLIAGTYQIDYNFNDSLPSGLYIMLLQTTKETITNKLVYLNDMIGSSNQSDFIKITFTDSIKVYDKIKVFDTTKVTITDTIKVYKTVKVYDSVKVSVYDTTKVLIMDTLNCIKTATNLRNYETFPSTESIVFHDNLTINFSGVDNLMLYDLTGKFIRRLTINSNLINLQDLKNGIYVGLFYENGDIIKTIKMIKE